MTLNKDHLMESTVSSNKIYQGRSFSFYTDIVKLPDGRTVNRDYVKYPEAVVIIPFLDNENIILIKQYRYPVKQVLLELPAGKIDDPNEAKEKAAFRELAEETGYKPGRLEFLFSFYPAVGYSSEKLFVFAAYDLTEDKQACDEDEFIEIEIVKYTKALQMIKDGEIVDSKTALALLYIDKLKHG